MKQTLSIAVAATTAYAQQQTPFWKQPNDWGHIKPTWDECAGDQCDPKVEKFAAQKAWNPCQDQPGGCTIPLCGKDASGSCKSPPSRMTCPASRNNGCQKVELNWRVPDSCCGIEVYHLQIKGANGTWNDAPKIPGAMTSWAINSNTLRHAPYFLAINDRVSFRIRGWSCNGWGGWSIDNEFSPNLPAKVLACGKYQEDECGENGRCEETPFSERAQMSIQHKCCKSKSREVRESCGCGNAATKLYSGAPTQNWSSSSNN